MNRTISLPALSSLGWIPVAPPERSAARQHWIITFEKVPWLEPSRACFGECGRAHDLLVCAEPHLSPPILDVSARSPQPCIQSHESPDSGSSSATRRHQPSVTTSGYWRSSLCAGMLF